MDDTRRLLLIIATVILGLALIGGVLAAAGAPDEATGVFLAPAGLTLFNPFFWIIVLIVWAVRRNKQQQQQQVVVVQGSPPQDAGSQVRCPACKGLSTAAAVFCGHCGRRF